MINEWVDTLTINRQAKHLPATLGRNRIYILPTPQGVLFFAVLIVMLLGSINFNNNLGFLFTFLLSSMTFVSLLHTHRNLAGIILQSAQVSPVFAGEKATLVLMVKPGLNARPGMCFGLKGENEVTVNLTPDTRKVTIPFQTKERGVLRVPPLTLSSTYPFGLFRTWSTVHPDMSYLVYPKPLYGPFQLGSGTRESENEGDREIMGTEDFKELRAYRPGDPFSRLSWKSFSTGKGLHTKEFSTPAGETLVLSWDKVADRDPEKKLSRLCHMIQHAHRMNLSYGLSIPGTDIPPGNPKDAGHYHLCLKALASFSGGRHAHHA